MVNLANMILKGELSYNTIEKENYWQLEVEGDKRQLIITLHKVCEFNKADIFKGCWILVEKCICRRS